MTSRRPYTAIDNAMSAWTRFWFRPESTITLGLVRIFFGAVIFLWVLSLLPDLLNWLGPEGITPQVPDSPYTWSVLYASNTAAAAYAVWAVTLLAALALTLGWHTRLAALIVFVGVMSVQRRQPWVFNSGDTLLRIETLFMVLAPAGSALSLDARRTTGSFWSVAERAPWTLRLFQVQCSIVYLVTFHDKITGVTWNEGTSISYALRLAEFQNFSVPHWVLVNGTLMNLAAWATLAVEFSLGTLIWKRKLRPWVILGGILLHLSIILTLAVSFFTWAIFVLYVAFIPVETATEWVGKFRARFGRREETPPDPEPARVEPAPAVDEVGEVEVTYKS